MKVLIVGGGLGGLLLALQLLKDQDEKERSKWLCLKEIRASGRGNKAS